MSDAWGGAWGSPSAWGVSWGTTVTPTPTPAARGGGTSKRIRSLPQYYSRQVFGEQVELPADPQSHEVAIDVLDQATGVIADLAEGAEYDALLQTVDQLARIAARQIESRQIYNVIEETRARVQAKKDAELRVLMEFAAEEEEVKELMELI